jgi:DNA helicase-2/ATP-dependent DNA helicase PcrA
VNNLKSTQKKNFATVKNHTPSPDFTASDTSNLSVGQKVEHPKFGFGKVVLMDEDGANRKAKVLFDNNGEKTLLLAFAKLRIIE